MFNFCFQQLKLGFFTVYLLQSFLARILAFKSQFATFTFGSLATLVSFALRLVRSGVKGQVIFSIRYRTFLEEDLPFASFRY